ncbi:MAG: beta-propeller domain-containing protein [Oligoflexia bacterium]|nr:beta-propeller domain-containing protein [Oligoflexia bacterium]
MKIRFPFSFLSILFSTFLLINNSQLYADDANSSTNSSNFTNEIIYNNSLNPVPQNPDSIKAQLSRYGGQSKFLNQISSSPNRINGRYADAIALRTSASVQREIQESDVYKVGKKDSKLLYLLNNYRGLQVISFKSGINRPELLGRSEASGSWSNNMYYHQASDRIISLEEVRRDNSVSGYSSYDYDYLITDRPKVSSRLLIYNISNPQAPKLAQEVSIEGRIVDSRMVGDILYVATQNNSYHGNGNEIRSEGRVLSFTLKRNQVESIDSLLLKTPLAHGELMNIVETVEQGNYHYYLLAVLNKAGQNWNNMSHSLAVIDISDAEGKIKPLMQVDLKGTLRERSQSFIKDKYLITVSNYRTSADNRLRISVESFKLPEETSSVTIYDKVVVDYRLHLLDQALKEKRAALSSEGRGDRDIEALISKYQKELISGKSLYKDQNLKLIDAYFYPENEKILQKVIHDYEINVGSTNELNASIQDVRFNEDLLYVFWVPQNMIDPLDVFDISKIKESIDYKGRLLFDGWIQRAIPIRYKDNNYIVGLGYIIPTVNNERNRSYPQAALFKITENLNGLINKELVSQITFSAEQNIWANFNSPDKMMDIHFDAENGQGTILFQAFTWSNQSYSSGGKLIGFDLAKDSADNARERNNIFTEGGFLKAQSGWLKRVFQNSEINKINTFTNQALATFDLSLKERIVGDHDKIFKTLSILELARNIRGYEVISSPATAATASNQLEGVQIISPYGYLYDDEDTKYTELRFVDSKKADSELSMAYNTLRIKGNYLESLKISPDKLLVLTREYFKKEQKYLAQNYLTLVKIENDNKFVFKLKEIPLDPERAFNTAYYSEYGGHGYYGFYNDHYNYFSSDNRPNNQLLKTFNKYQLIILGGDFFLLDINGMEMKIDKIDLSSCAYLKENKNNMHGLSFTLINQKPYLRFYQQVKDPQNEYKFYQRFLILPLLVNDNGEWNCKDAINIPGLPLYFKDNLLITKDINLIDRFTEDDTEDDLAVRINSVFPIRSMLKFDLIALKIEEENLATTSDTKVSLQDLYEGDKIIGNGIFFLNASKMIFLQSDQANPPTATRFLPPIYHNRDRESSLVYLDVDSNFRFTKENYFIGSNFGNRAEIARIFSLSIPNEKNEYYLFFQSQREVRVGKINDQHKKVRLLSLVELDPQYNEKEKRDFIITHNFFNYWNHRENWSKIHFTAANKSIEIAEDFHGIKQFSIKE